MSASESDFFTEYDRAVALQDRGKYLEASKIFDQLLEISPEHRQARKRLVLCLLLAGSKFRARDEMASYLQKFPDDLQMKELSEKSRPVVQDQAQIKEERKKIIAAIPNPTPWLMIQCELFTPTFVGLDVSTFLGPKMNVGLGMSGLSSGTLGLSVWHPRLRWYHRKHAGWTWFGGLSAIVADIDSKTSGQTHSRLTWRGGDLQLGFARLRPGIFTTEVIFTIAGVNSVNEFDLLGTPRSTTNLIFFANPGVGFGFAF